MRIISIVGFLTAAVLAAGCSDSPTVPYATPGEEAALKKDRPPTSDIPVKLSEFTGGIQSDRPLYAEVLTDGRLWMELEPGKKDTDPPQLCVSLPDPIVTHSDAELAEFKAAGGVLGAENCFTNVTLHTRDASIEGGLYEQEPYSTIMAGGKIVLKDLASSKQNPWEWRLIFDTSWEDIDNPEIGKGVCVDRFDGNDWTMYNECTVGGVDVDSKIELWRVVGGWTHVADFLIPFSFNLNGVQ